MAFFGPTTKSHFRRGNQIRIHKEMTQLAGDLQQLYRDASRERAALHRLAMKSPKASLLDLIEQFVDTVQGHAMTIAEDKSSGDSRAAIKALAKQDAFELLERSADYPKLRRYVAFADYLRRLAIEYFETSLAA